MTDQQNEPPARDPLDRELEQLLRDWGKAERSTDPVPPEIPTERFRRRWWRPSGPFLPGYSWVSALVAPLVVVVVVVVAVGGVVALITQQTGDTRQSSGVGSDPQVSAAAESPASSSVPPPHGSRPAVFSSPVFHGLTFRLPGPWPLNKRGCDGLPTQDTVLVPVGSAGTGCGKRLPHHSSVRLSRVLTAGQLPKLKGPTRTTTTIGGHRATLVRGTTINRPGGDVQGGDAAAILTIPAIDVTAVVISPTKSMIGKIVGTADTVAQDPFGCAARRAGLQPLPTGRPPARPGADTALVPGRPTGAAICRYVGGWLEMSAVVTKLGALQRTLNSLPAGLSTTGPQDRNCPPKYFADNEASVIRIGYADGGHFDVITRIGECGLLGASNGTRTGQRLWSLVTLVTDAVQGSSGFPQTVQPAH